MANRDEVISFLLNVKGAEDLSVVAGALRDAGIAGEEAKPEIAALVAELEQLAATNSAASRFASLTTELGEVSIAISDAKLKVDELTTSFGEAGPATAAQARQLANAIIAVGQLTDKEAQLRTELAATTETLAASGIATNDIAQAQTRLGTQAALTAEKLRLVAEAAQLTGTAEEKEAVTVEELAEKYAAFGHTLETFKELAITIGGLIAFEKVKEEIGEIISTGDKFEKWGIQFANAFGGAEQGAEALEKVKELAEHVPISLDDLVQVAIKAKKEGLDPLNGTLQTLIDVNATYGGSIDSLNGLVDAFGKAQARGVLNTRLLVTLTQQGVPAARLLGDAMGKTGDQIEEMAKKSELGRDAISLLLQKLADGSSGAAGKSMDLLSTQVIKLHDDWDEFLKLIADSGVYDFAKEELKQVGEALKAGLGDGTLKEKAQAISDAIVSIGKVAAGTVQFIIDHAGAIKTVAEAYGLLRAAGLAVDLVTMVNGFRTSTAAALQNTAAIQKNAAAQLTLTEEMAAAVAEMNAQTAAAERNAAAQVGLATAMKSAAVSAQAEAAAVGGSAVALDAASKGGIIAALKSFGSLRDMVNGVGTAIAGLAGGPTVALVASIGFTVYAAINMIAALKDWYNVTVEVDEAQKALAASQVVLVDRAKQVAAQTKAAADVQIKSASDIKTMSAEQSEAYLQQLQDATRYYTALRIQARDANDPEKVAEYTAKLRELGDAQREVAGESHDAGEETKKAADIAAKAIETLVEQVLKFRAEGVAAPIAVQGAFDNLKINTPTGFQTIISMMSNLKGLSGDVGGAFQSELIDKLEKLNDIEFEEFKRRVADALGKGVEGAKELQRTLDTVSFLKLGLSAQQAGVDITQAGAKIIGGFGDIANSANITGEKIQLAFAKALSQLKTTGEVDELKAQLTAAFNAGKIKADEFTAAMEAAARKTTAIQVEAIKSGAALDGMGTAGQSAVQRTNAALDDMRSKLVAQAAVVQAQIDAYAQKGEQAPAALLAQYKALQDQIKGLTESMNALGASGTNANNNIAGSAGSAAQEMDEAAKAAARYKKAMDDLRGGKGGIDDVTAAMDNAANSTQKAAAAAEGVDAKMHAAAGAGQSLAQVMANTAAQFSAVSKAAGDEFSTAMDRALQNIGLTKIATTDLSKSLGALDASAADLSGFTSYFRALAAVEQQTQEKIDGQRQALASSVGLLNTYGTAAQQNFGIAGQGADKLLASLEAQRNALAQGNSGFDLLGQQELGPLQQALDGAIQRTQQLADAAKQAEQQYESLAQSIHDSLLQEQGNQSALEDERHQKQLADLKAAAEAANSLNSDSYQKAVQEENELHDLKMQNLQKQAQAAAATSKSGGSASTSTGGGSSTTTSSSGGGGAGSAGGVNFGSGAIQITLSGLTKPLANMSNADIEDFAQQLMPVLMPNLMHQIVYQLQLAKSRS